MQQIDDSYDDGPNLSGHIYGKQARVFFFKLLLPTPFSLAQHLKRAFHRESPATTNHTTYIPDQFYF